MYEAPQPSRRLVWRWVGSGTTTLHGSKHVGHVWWDAWWAGAARHARHTASSTAHHLLEHGHHGILRRVRRLARSKSSWLAAIESKGRRLTRLRGGGVVMVRNIDFVRVWCRRAGDAWSELRGCCRGVDCAVVRTRSSPRALV